MARWVSSWVVFHVALLDAAGGAGPSRAVELEYSVRVANDNNVSTYHGTFADGTASEATSVDSLKEVVRFRRADPSPTPP